MTSQPHSDAEIREQVKLILGRMHYRTVHYETPKIDVPHKIDDTCPYKCMETATKAILALIKEQTRLARIDELESFYTTVPQAESDWVDGRMAELEGVGNLPPKTKMPSKPITRRKRSKWNTS